MMSIKIPFKKIHFVGIGGIGMSALADILAGGGISVSGSDLRENDLTAKLAGKGVSIFKGHCRDNVPHDNELTVVSTGIREDNPEIVFSSEMGIPVIPRSEMLRMLIECSECSAGVTGTHGKTTTTGMVSYAVDISGLDPIVAVGGEMSRFGGNSRSGSGLIVAEIDESDGHFKNISVTNALVTNIEREHMEHYGDMDSLLSAYRAFMANVRPGGTLIFNGDDKVLSELTTGLSSKKISYGMSKDREVTCGSVGYKKGIEIDLLINKKKRGTIKSPLAGIHNVKNFLAASAMCYALGMDMEKVCEAFGTFDGVKRRFEFVGKVGEIRVIEDYAHHPTELEHVIKSAKDLYDGRVISVFQPHRYSRTADLEKDFAGCFRYSDILIVTDIYSADEEPIGGRGIDDFFGAIDKKGFIDARIVEKTDVPGVVSGIVEDKDTVLVLGAGDIRDISKQLLRQISAKLSIPACDAY